MGPNQTFASVGPGRAHFRVDLALLIATVLSAGAVLL